VEETMAASRQALSKGHPRTFQRKAHVKPAVSMTPQTARPPAGRATALKSLRLMPKPPWKRNENQSEIGDPVGEQGVVEMPEIEHVASEENAAAEGD
jgi:hypothetical protein